MDWSKIDLSEFVAELLAEAQKGIPTAADLQSVTNRVSGNVSSDGVKRDYNYTP